MIKQETYTLDWIKGVAQSHRKADPILIEKVIRALTLLDALGASGLDFIFKGGTSLMLIFPEPKRLSIDIDIILADSNVDLPPLFSQLIASTNFTRFEEQERKKTTHIEKAHYKFFYSPIHKTNQEEEYILLDILFEVNHYPALTTYPVQSAFLQTDGIAQRIKTPTIEGLLGDKLTAFAPATTGIPYMKHDKSMSMEIMKQLYDIGNLFDVAEDLPTIRNTFLALGEVELIYRNHTEKSIADVHEDIHQTALTISSRGVYGSGKYSLLQEGIDRVSRFIFSETFHLDKVILAGAKAAYINHLIRHGHINIEKYQDSANIKDWIIEDPVWNKLNKLKKSNPEAFFYWYQIVNNAPAKNILQ
jgi:predicted nucleotidyltransferase component of viral defense system